MSNIFTIDTSETLFKKRLARLLEFRRIPIGLIIKLCFFYLRKAFNKNIKSIDDNYYFLTLISTNSFNINRKEKSYLFKTNCNQKLLARKLPSSDLEVFNQVWGRKDYRKATDLVKQFCKKTSDQMVIIDAGANVGYCTVFFNTVFPDAKIIAIEPDVDNFSVLLKNTELNNLKNVICLQAGLWSSLTNLKIIRDYADYREWAIRVEGCDEETGLKGVSFESLFSEYNIEDIDLLKIDIEGSEGYLFDDALRVKNFLKRTKVIAIEIHDKLASRDRIYQLLVANSFVITNSFDFSDLTIAIRKH